MRFALAILTATVAFAACNADDRTAGDDAGAADMPAADCAAGRPGIEPKGTSKAKLTVIGNLGDGLAAPMGLAFAPEHPDQLWVVNQRTNDVVIFFDPGTPMQRSETRRDAYGRHFMSQVAGIAFGANNQFASCQESRDPWNVSDQAPDDFMGPTLWPADLDVFARVNQAYPKPPGGKEGSHIDMLHESPLCVGIAHEADNVYWVFDGLHGHLVRYDFQDNHGPGGSDHSDGIVRRYVEAEVTRVEHITGQLAFDPETHSLFAADTGGGRITRLDTRSGVARPTQTPIPMETLREYSQVEGARYDVIASDFAHPSGLVLHDGLLYVAEHDTGDIVTLDRCGNEIERRTTDARSIMGLTVSPAGELYFVDRDDSRVLEVLP